MNFMRGTSKIYVREGQGDSWPTGNNSMDLLEVFVVIDILPLSRILQSVATDVLPHSIDNIGSLGSVDPQQPRQLARQLVLDRLEGETV